VNKNSRFHYIHLNHKIKRAVILTVLDDGPGMRETAFLTKKFDKCQEAQNDAYQIAKNTKERIKTVRAIAN